MYLDHHIQHSQWTAPNFNEDFNNILSFIKLWGGRIALFILLPIAIIIVVILYYTVKRVNKRTIKLIEKKGAELISMLRNTEVQDFRSVHRGVFKEQVELRILLQEMKTVRNNRKVASSLIMQKFLNQEDKLIYAVEKVNEDLRLALNPNINRTFTEAEIERMRERASYQDDLDDKELDASIEALYA